MGHTLSTFTDEQNWEEWLVHCRAGAAGGPGQTGNGRNLVTLSKGKCQDWPWGGVTPSTSTHWHPGCGKQPCRKTLLVQVTTQKGNPSWQTWLVGSWTALRRVLPAGQRLTHSTSQIRELITDFLCCFLMCL